MTNSNSKGQSIIIFDRDGVINQDSPDYIRSVDQMVLIEEAVEAMASLSMSGYVVVVATNQSGIARGYFSELDLNKMFKKIQCAVQAKGGFVSHFYFCPHHPTEKCDCRKPKPGMLSLALEEFNGDASCSWMIGDSSRDILAGRAAGLHVALVRTGNGRKEESQWKQEWGGLPLVFDHALEVCNYIHTNHPIAVLDANIKQLPVTFFQFLRAILFQICWAISTIPYSSLLILFTLIGVSLTKRYQIASAWGACSVWLAKYICGIDYRILHKSAIPKRPVLIFSNHQSAWETVALISILPPTAFIVKKQLLYVPFFGMGLWSIRPIAIDRHKKINALEQLVAQGEICKRQGRCILIFPQGTRTPINQNKNYQRGGVHVAQVLQVPILLIAHNAGKYWGEHWWQKYPGTITISFGPTIDCESGDLYKISTSWIEQESKRLLLK
ncbi:MAG: D-glycero-beta-D-manno-heptose 1,7-bisphosphate 7-phosphatase [Methylacidiphilales bacterium]|nr:D-glycero-beta-D-manno-heptose 1,7-bisphosphate 7-phosphatase [Candidatus Methylacidiphilales bacterium]